MDVAQPPRVSVCVLNEVANVLPNFPNEFRNALITDVTLGPRREVTFQVEPLVWVGPNGEYGAPIQVRCGAITNWDIVQSFFTSERRLPWEIAWLRYAKEPLSKPDAIFIEIQSEREDSHLMIECRHVTVA
jgi:hypothetical protein